MQRGIREIRTTRPVPDAINSLKNTLTAGGSKWRALTDSSAAVSESGEPFASVGLFLLCAICALSLYSWGCAGKKPIVNQPLPIGPSAAPSANEEDAKRSTDVPEMTGSSKPASSLKRGRLGAAPAAAGYSEEGNASWYGEPFNGRRASNGETYDMHKLTAAHRTLPFETMLRVTNLNNGKFTTVRITDRGPFVENRIIDLSQAAAREIELIGPGVGRVRIEVLGGVDPATGYFTVQVGAFRDRGNAQRLRDRLSVRYNSIQVRQFGSGDGVLYRVQVGKVSGEEAAGQLSEELQEHEKLSSFVVRLDE
jgi:rare lipoprotein A